MIFFTTEHWRVNKLIIMPHKVIFCIYFYEKTFYLMHFIMKRQICRRFNTLPDCSHSYEVTGIVAQILINTWKSRYMSWSQAFRDEAMTDGRSFFDTDSHLLFHWKKVSSALKGIDRSSWYYPIISFTAVSRSTPGKGMSLYIKWTVLLYFSNLFSMPCIMKWSSKEQQTFLKHYWNAVFDSAFTKKFS